MNQTSPLVCSLVLLLTALLLCVSGCSSGESEGGRVKVSLEGRDESVLVAPGADGTMRFHLRLHDGSTEELPAEEFAQKVYREQASRPMWMRVLNITSTAGVFWVTLGFLGQVLFTGRMIVQWVASEKAKRSTVPTIFWWLSFGGASILLVYFIWRKDIIGVIGQCTGWFVYLRNLLLIHRQTIADR